MNLSPEGKKRLDAMKKALAAGLPLAGLLAMAACSKGQQEETSSQPQRNWVYLGETGPVMQFDSSEDDAVMGDFIDERSFLIPDNPAPDIGPIEELVIAEDCTTSGLMFDQEPRQLPGGDGKRTSNSSDDVIVRVEDAPQAQEETP
jgi:hypothetical protein